MGREQDLNTYDHKVLDCPQNPRKHVVAWRSDNRLVFITTDLPDNDTPVKIIGTATISLIQQLYNTCRFQCPGCTGNGCDVILGSATKAKEIPEAFRSIKIVPVPIEELSPV